MLAFPCNQFGQQEPGKPDEIQAFAKSYGLVVDKASSNFHLMKKVNVNGPKKSSVYEFLRQHSGDADIRWNFNTKFVVHCDDTKDTCEITRHDGISSTKALKKATPNLDLDLGGKKKGGEL